MPNIGQELASLDFSSMLGGPLVAAVNAQAQASVSALATFKEIGFTPDTTDQNGNVVPGSPIYVSFKYPKEIAAYQPATNIVQSVTLQSPGAGYTAPPIVTLTGGGGQGATAVALISAAGQVTGVQVTNPGTGYTSAPTVQFTGGGGTTQATATASTATTAAVPAVIEEMKLEVPILLMIQPGMLVIDEVTIDFNAKLNSVEYAASESSLGIQGGLTVEQRWPRGRAKLNVSAAYQSKTSQGTTVEKTYSLAVHMKASQAEFPGVEHILGILEKAMREQPALAPAS